MPPTPDWLLENATEIMPNLWRADSALPVVSTWPVAALPSDFSTHADTRGPRLVHYALEFFGVPSLMCWYPTRGALIDLSDGAEEIGRPIIEGAPTGPQGVVGAMVGFSCPDRETDTWEVMFREPLPASQLVIAVEDYEPIPMVPEVSAVLLAISRGAGNDGPITDLDLEIEALMIEDELADGNLLEQIRDDQIFRQLANFERRDVENTPPDEPIEIPGFLTAGELNAARQRGEDRRRIEGFFE